MTLPLKANKRVSKLLIGVKTSNSVPVRIKTHCPIGKWLKPLCQQGGLRSSHLFPYVLENEIFLRRGDLR
jgi:hypothetical protein